MQELQPRVRNGKPVVIVSTNPQTGEVQKAVVFDLMINSINWDNPMQTNSQDPKTYWNGSARQGNIVVPIKVYESIVTQHGKESLVKGALFGTAVRRVWLPKLDVNRNKVLDSKGNEIPEEKIMLSLLGPALSEVKANLFAIDFDAIEDDDNGAANAETIAAEAAEVGDDKL